MGFKYSIEQRSRKYDELYIKASEVLAEFNPCKIENGTCIKGRCGESNFCCDGCYYLSDEGCMVQCLYCRTWICEEAAKNIEDKYGMFNEIMNQIDDEAREYGLFVFRASKEENLERILESAD